MEDRGPGIGFRALVVDDEENVRRIIEAVLGDLGYDVFSAEDIAQGLARWGEVQPDLVVTDKNLPDGSCVELVKQIREQRPDADVVMMSAFANLDSAVEAIRLGVADYLLKPFQEISSVSERLARVTRNIKLKRDNQHLLEALQQTNRKLEEMVVRDSLTGLFNHAHFQERLESEVRRSARHNHAFGLIFFDIDHFKEINDGLGHPVGDNVLKGIADALHGQTRRSDDSFRLRDHDLAARYGGDEFVVLLPETSKTSAATKAERLRAFVEQLFFTGAATKVTLSVGVAGYPEDGDSRAALISAADTALYAAKRLGRNRVMSYTPALSPRAGRHSVSSDLPARQLVALERVIAERLFRTVYQPVVDTESWQLLGYEALGRPEEPIFTDILDLLATAERAGRVAELGRGLRTTAVGAMAELTPPALLFLNLHQAELFDSALLLPEPALLPWIDRIVLELTNSAALKESPHLKATTAALRELGFKVALDDIAPSYAGLNALAQHDVDYVKLDRTLFRDVHSDSRRSRLIKHILEYAQGEGISIVAEGVETVEECRVMRALGVRYMQGFLFGRGEPGFAPVALPPPGL